jgi:biotin operon repressor
VTIVGYLTRQAQTKKALAERMGIPARDVEEAVRLARLDGAPILSDGDGYRLAADPAELEAQARRLRIRAAHQFVTARAVRRSARRMQEQQDAAQRPSGTLWG